MHLSMLSSYRVKLKFKRSYSIQSIVKLYPLTEIEIKIETEIKSKTDSALVYSSANLFPEIFYEMITALHSKQ